VAGAAEVRAAEQRLYRAHGLEPNEHLLDLDRLGSTARLVEVAARSTGEGVQTAGAEDVVLFLHGFAGGGALWASLAAALPDLRCLLLDRPGGGLSELPPGALTNPEVKERLATELVADVCDALELDACHVVSSSMGGWFALRSAAAHPDRVRSIVGLGYQSGGIVDRPNVGMRVQPPASILAPLARRVPLPLTAGMVRTAMKLGGLGASLDDDEASAAMLAWVVALFRNTEALANDLATTPRAVNLRGLNPQALLSPADGARITAPVHLFWGTDDMLASEASARSLAALLPNATVEMVEGAGHAPWLDEPDRAVQAIRNQVRSTREAAPGPDGPDTAGTA
jgi:pimeloyl-ACP methyl ester carboxylesterase